MANYDKIYLTQAQLETLANGGSITGGSVTYTGDENVVYMVPPTAVTDLTSTTQTVSLVSKTRYNYGTLTSLALTFPAVTASKDGDKIIINFISGSTATTFTLNTSPAICNFSAFSSNSFCEISAEYKGSISKWVVLLSEVPYVSF